MSCHYEAHFFSLSCFGSARGSRKGKAQTVEALSRIDHGGETPVPGDAADGHSNSSWPAVAGSQRFGANALFRCWGLDPRLSWHFIPRRRLLDPQSVAFEEVVGRFTTKSVAKWLSFILLLIVVGCEYLPLVWAVAIFDHAIEIKVPPRALPLAIGMGQARGFGVSCGFRVWRKPWASMGMGMEAVFAAAPAHAEINQEVLYRFEWCCGESCKIPVCNCTISKCTCSVILLHVCFDEAGGTLNKFGMMNLSLT